MYPKIREIGAKKKKEKLGKIKESTTHKKPKMSSTVEIGTTKMFVIKDDKDIYLNV